MRDSIVLTGLSQSCCSSGVLRIASFTSSARVSFCECSRICLCVCGCVRTCKEKARSAVNIRSNEYFFVPPPLHINQEIQDQPICKVNLSCHLDSKLVAISNGHNHTGPEMEADIVPSTQYRAMTNGDTRNFQPTTFLCGSEQYALLAACAFARVKITSCWLAKSGGSWRNCILSTKETKRHMQCTKTM